MGSKSRIAKYIVPILQQCIDKNHISNYIEPFCGGCNIIDKIRCEHKIANDLNTYLIAFLSYVSKGGKLLDNVPKDLYDEVRSNYKSNIYDNWYVGNIGFLASYNGRFFDGGYAKSVYENGKLRDYYQESKCNLKNQADKLKGIEFLNSSYELIDPPLIINIL
jgi:DNA adenine methylase